MKNFLRITIDSFKSVLIYIILLGLVYPMMIYLIGIIFMPGKVNGSLIDKGGYIYSELIVQQMNDPRYFRARPSAVNYNALPSGASNYAIGSELYIVIKDSLKNAFILENKLSPDTKVPPEMYSYSASGLDPHISPESAFMQVERICRARDFNEDMKKKLNALIESNIEDYQFGLLGSKHVNVLLINHYLDNL